MKIGRRQIVAVLGGGSAGIAGLVGAVSLTRIAGDYLGFPPGLEWTLTGAVDVAGVAGAVMWTAFDGSVRKIGRPMSIVCTTVSGIGVGLDHATHAGKALNLPGLDGGSLPGTGMVSWPWIAFAAGVFIPALLTWLLHALAVIRDEAAPGGRVPLVRDVVASRVPVSRGPVFLGIPVAGASRGMREVGAGTPPGDVPVAVPAPPAEPPVATAGSSPVADQIVRDAREWARKQERDTGTAPGWRAIQREFPGLSESRCRAVAPNVKRPVDGAQLRRVQ